VRRIVEAELRWRHHAACLHLFSQFYVIGFVVIFMQLHERPALSFFSGICKIAGASQAASLWDEKVDGLRCLAQISYFKIFNFRLKCQKYVKLKTTRATGNW